MFHALLLFPACAAVLLAAGLDDSPDGSVAPTQMRWATDANALVARALQAETRGRDGERRAALEAAVRANPDHVRARGLIAHVHDGARWDRPETNASRFREDSVLALALAEYRLRRAVSAGVAADHRRLALWCETRGLRTEARAHFTVVTRLEPEDASTWRRLARQPPQCPCARISPLAAGPATGAGAGVLRLRALRSALRLNTANLGFHEGRRVR
jgi:hypothetical protein